jgi:predicted glutamine amidotransferase
MALVISKGQPLNTFEIAMKSEWTKSNDDGVGIYWRDASDGKRHLTRFKDSKDLAKIPNDYDRLFVHFRKSTKGEGTHPFICRCRPDLKSEQWMVAHNGCVDDSAARESLIVDIEKKGLKAHTFNTLIDSESFAHVWGELTETDLLERAKMFTATCEELHLNGWANLIFYNVVTDEYVIFVDNAMHIVQSKKRNITVFCSDSQWFDHKASKKLGVTDDEVAHGTVIYGKGNDFKTKKKVWLVKSRNNQTQLVVSTGAPIDAVNNSMGNVKQLGGGLYSGSEADIYSRAFIEDHVYVPSKYPDEYTNKHYCNECYQPREYHVRVYTSEEDEPKGLGETAESWEPGPAIPDALGRRKAEKSKGFDPKANGNVLLRLQVNDCCRPQKSDPNDATGICQKHYEQGFRGFYYDPKEKTWYLVRSLYYKTNDMVAYDSGLPKE